MHLLDYRNFLITESLLLENVGEELKNTFSKFDKDLGKEKITLLNYVRTELSVEIKEALAGLLNGSMILTVYPTVIKIRSRQGGRIAEFSKDVNKNIDEILASLINGKTPTNRYEKGCALIIWLMNENPEAIFWSPKDSLAKETLALNDIKNKLNLLKGPNESINILLRGQIYNTPGSVELVNVEKVIGTPKADFIFEISGNPPLYISHKDGKSADDFQQYGGMDSVRDHTFVKEFINFIQEKVGNEFVSGQVFAVVIPKEHEDLAIKAIFGNDASGKNKNWSKDNIQIVMQGEIKFEQSKIDESAYEISPTGHILYHPALTDGQLSINTNDPYWPALYVRYSKGDGGSFGFKNGRFMIWPQGNRETARGFKQYDQLLKE